MWSFGNGHTVDTEEQLRFDHKNGRGRVRELTLRPYLTNSIQRSPQSQSSSVSFEVTTFVTKTGGLDPD